MGYVYIFLEGQACLGMFHNWPQIILPPNALLLVWALQHSPVIDTVEQGDHQSEQKAK
jgi:hypothetical protein